MPSHSHLEEASKATGCCPPLHLDESSVAGAVAADSTLELRDLTDNNFLDSYSSLQQSSSYATIDSRIVTRHKRASDPQKANLLKCIRKFNENPKAGVQLLEELGILDATDPEQIAKVRSLIKLDIATQAHQLSCEDKRHLSRLY